MVYFIEISVCLKKSVNLTQIKNDLRKKANECRCTNYYDNYEIAGHNRNIKKNKCILSFHFEEHDELFADFIKYTKKNSKTNIEFVAIDDTIFEIIFASHSYLNSMDKFLAKKFIEKRKNGTLPKMDSIVYTVLHKKYR